MDTIVKIEELMNEKGWTKYRLAKESGLPQTTITSLFSGRVKSPSTETLSKIAAALGVNSSVILGEEVPMFEISAEKKNELRTKLHDDLVEALDLFASPIPEQYKQALVDIKEKYVEIIGENAVLGHSSLLSAYEEIQSIEVTSTRFSTFHAMLTELIDLKSNIIKNPPAPGSAAREFSEKIELSDEELLEQFSISIDGVALSQKDIQKIIAQVRIDRMFDGQ
jgi:transcriptional regulator with XRE-family HTH domain